MRSLLASNKDLTVILGISGIACIFLFWLIYFAPTAEAVPAWAHYLPHFNAFCNLLSATCLLTGYLHIKKGRTAQHRQAMISAFLCSTFFLLGYILHHSLNGDTLYQGQGWWRPTYFFILITHITLSIVALPMVLYTFWLALRGRKKQHKRLARWTFPIWMYVSVTGVLIFVLLRTS